MIAYKGFTKDLTARMGKGVYQFEIGKTVEEAAAKCANTGFHCAEDPLDVLTYYNSENDRYCIVEADGDIHEDACGSRISCTRITLIKEISRQQLALHGCNFMYQHPERECSRIVQTEKGKADKYFAIVRGKDPVAKGSKGTLLLLLKELPDSSEIQEIAAYEVDGKEYRENVFYDIGGKEVGHEKGRTKEIKNT